MPPVSAKRGKQTDTRYQARENALIVSHDWFWFCTWSVRGKWSSLWLLRNNYPASRGPLIFLDRRASARRVRNNSFLSQCCPAHAVTRVNKILNSLSFVTLYRSDSTSLAPCLALMEAWSPMHLISQSTSVPCRKLYNTRFVQVFSTDILLENNATSILTL